MGKAKRRQSRQTPDIIGPTPEQAGAFELTDVNDKRAGGASITIGKAYRRKPMIDVLANIGLLTDREHKALHHYRHHADIVDRSIVRDSLNFQRGGDGSPTITLMNAKQVVRDIETAAGSLRDILRAVVVEDKSLSQWAALQHGSTERCRDRAGRTVCVLEPSAKALEIARLDIKMAARRVEAEVAATPDRKKAA